MSTPGLTCTDGFCPYPPPGPAGEAGYTPGQWMCLLDVTRRLISGGRHQALEPAVRQQGAPLANWLLGLLGCLARAAPPAGGPAPQAEQADSDTSEQLQQNELWEHAGRLAAHPLVNPFLGAAVMRGGSALQALGAMVGMIERLQQQAGLLGHGEPPAPSARAQELLAVLPAAASVAAATLHGFDAALVQLDTQERDVEAQQEAAEALRRDAGLALWVALRVLPPTSAVLTPACVQLNPDLALAAVGLVNKLLNCIGKRGQACM